MMKISIIIPIKNGENVIKKSISSALEQSCKDIEVICVDDASTDGTAALLKQIQASDDRVKIISFDSTKGALLARSEGIKTASGEYIMFLDADDYLDTTACETLYLMMKKKQVDILHFSSCVVDCGAGSSRTDNMQEFVAPYTKKLSGAQVFEGCFCQKLYQFNLWNKIYKASVCKEAVNYLEEGYFPKANDLYAYFIIAMQAESYIGIECEPLYFYQFGGGSTGSSSLSLEQFDIYCHEQKVAGALKKFITNYPQYEKYSDVVDELHKKLLKECLWNWKEHMDKQLQSEAFDILVKHWGRCDTVIGIVENYHFQCGQIADMIGNANVLAKDHHEIQTIGIFYFRIAGGGVQRVISLQIPMFIKLGYKIVLFTDEYDPENEYDFPDEVKRVILPNSVDGKVGDYRMRAPELERELKEQKIDLMLYHAGTSPMLLYDMLITKSMGIPFVITLHELFSQGMVNLSSWLRRRAPIYRIADKMIVLSKTEQLYWTARGVSSEYIQNPIEDIQCDERERTYILWLGRFDRNQKQYEDAIHIMQQVVSVCPDAIMHIVGNDFTPGATENLEKLIDKFDLENNVKLLPFQKDVKELYEGAKIHLLTSAYESFPMTIIESKSYGVPLVLYEMPYLELLKDGKGYYSVPQGDRKQAAQKIIALLENPELCKEKSKEARESIQYFKEFDLESKWDTLIKGIFTEKDATENNSVAIEDMNVIIETMLFHYEKGITKYNWLIKQKNDLQKQLNKLKKSKAYRWSEAILRYPRKAYHKVKRFVKVK